MEKLMMIN